MAPVMGADPAFKVSSFSAGFLLATLHARCVRHTCCTSLSGLV